MKSPRYTILVANRKTGVVRRLSVVRRVVVLATLGTLAVPVLMGLGARWSARAEIDALRASNDTLHEQNESYRNATSELAEQISSLQTAMTQLGEQNNLTPEMKAALDKLPAVIKSRAMGGATAADLARMQPIDPPDRTFGILRDLLSVLGARLDTFRKTQENRQALAAATPYIWPLFDGWLSSSFGRRADPITGEAEDHAGLDLSADRGTEVHATADGTVESAAYNGGYGNSILIQHGFGIETRFGHLSAYAVRAGQAVKRGQVIGYVGSSGRTTGPHLHYEILINGSPINPLRMLAH